MLCLHIGPGLNDRLAPTGPDRQPDRPPSQISISRTGPLLGRAMPRATRISRSPCPRAASAGSRSTSSAPTVHARTGWIGHDFGGQAPSRRLSRALLACYVDRANGLRRATRSALTSSPGSATTRTPTPTGPRRRKCWTDCNRRGARRRDPQDHVAERLPLLRLGPVRPTPREPNEGRGPPRQGHRRRRLHPPTQGMGSPLRGKAARLIFPRADAKAPRTRRVEVLLRLFGVV